MTEDLIRQFLIEYAKQEVSKDACMGDWESSYFAVGVCLMKKGHDGPCLGLWMGKGEEGEGGE